MCKKFDIGRESPAWLLVAVESVTSWQNSASPHRARSTVEFYVGKRNDFYLTAVMDAEQSANLWLRVAACA